jgi:hypothetical protein
MGADLAHAVDVRADAAEWLLGERFPDWQLALVAVSEPHSAIEGLWHGLDVAHPLHHLASAAPAGAGLRTVYRAVDRLIGRLAARFPDALTLVFSMGGMGENRSDLPSMLLLPELLYRHAFGAPFFVPPAAWSMAQSPEMPVRDIPWEHAVAAGLRTKPVGAGALIAARARRAASQLLPWRLRMRLKDLVGSRPLRLPLTWMPATAYQPFWHRMPAFALPSFYDGRVRLNLRGRERHGLVNPEDYRRIRDGIVDLIEACIDPATGKSAVDAIEFPGDRDPSALGETDSDIVVVWKGCATSLVHPTLGTLGPAPYRRTGGHTGPFGMAYVRADGLGIGTQGIRSSFDVVPTIIDLLGLPRPRGLSGESLLADVARPAATTLRRAS